MQSRQEGNWNDLARFGIGNIWVAIESACGFRCSPLRLIKEEATMKSMRDEMVKQSQNIEPSAFLCDYCKSYKGKLSCEKGIFIAFAGANLSHCSFFERGRSCKYCGRIT